MASDTNIQTQQRNPPSPQQQFGRTVSALAEKGLQEMFGSENGRAAAARVAVAFRAATAAAKDPSSLYKCSPESVASCMALSAMTQIMPGGPYPGCYLVPKAGALGWWISARGIKTLAQRAGQTIHTFPYFTFDAVDIDEFEQTMRLDKGEGDRDDYSKLMGIVVLVRDATTGAKRAMVNITREQIEKRRKKSTQPNGDSWRDWPMEMALKTAIKYAAARGDVVFDDVGNVTMQRDADVIDVPHTEVNPPRQLTAGMSALDAALDQREPVEVSPTEELTPTPT